MTRGEWIAVAVATLGLGAIGVFAFTRRRSDGPIGDAEPTLVDQEVEALARAIASEAGGESREIQTGVGWAILNESIRRGVTLWSLVRGKTGNWGPQSANGYVSSAREPTAAQRELARAIMANEVTDPTGGATQFDSPAAQRALVARNSPGYVKTPEQVAAARRADGKVLVLLPGVPEDKIRFWRPA